jgi:hypothetical protein
LSLLQFGAGVLLDPIWSASKGITPSNNKAASRTQTFGATLDLILSNIKADVMWEGGRHDEGDIVGNLLECRKRQSGITLVRLVGVIAGDHLAHWVQDFIQEGLGDSLDLSEVVDGDQVSQDIPPSTNSSAI